MLKLLKVFGRGVLVTVLLPFILLIWVLYGVYCICAFVFMFFKTTIEYFQGKTYDANLPEDLEARRILLERERANEQARDALSMMYQNSLAQQVQKPEEPTEETESYSYKQEYTDSESYDEASFEESNEAESEELNNDYGEEPDDLRGN